MAASTAGPNHATRNQGADSRKRRGFITLFLKPSRVTRRVTSTPMAGKNMAAPVANCAAIGGMPVKVPEAIGYTTPNSYAHVSPNVTAKKTTMRFIALPFLARMLFWSARSRSRGCPSYTIIVVNEQVKRCSSNEIPRIVRVLLHICSICYSINITNNAERGNYEEAGSATG